MLSNMLTATIPGRAADQFRSADSDIPDQTQFVQAGIAYLRSLYDLKALFSTYDLTKFAINSPTHCAAAMAMQFETGDKQATYYDFIDSHILPDDPVSLGFAVYTTPWSPLSVDAETGKRLNTAWKAAIEQVLAE